MRTVYVVVVEHDFWEPDPHPLKDLGRDIRVAVEKTPSVRSCDIVEIPPL